MQPIPPEHELESGQTLHSAGFVVSVLLVQQLFGALTFPVAKFGLAHLEPFSFAFYRFVISSAVLLIMVKFKRHHHPIEKKDYWKIVGLGFLIIPFNQAMYLWGQSMTAAGHGALLFATVPIWIFLAAVIHLKEKLVLRRAIGIVVALAGVAVIMSGGAIRLGTDYLLGDAIILVAVLAWAYYTILGKDLARKYGALRVTAYALSSGSLIYFPFGIYRASQVNYALVPLSTWLSVVYVAIGTSVISYVLYYWVLKYFDASRIAVFHNLQPVIASAVALVWLGEPLGTTFFVGGAVALIGVIIAEQQTFGRLRSAQ